MKTDGVKCQPNGGQDVVTEMWYFELVDDIIKIVGHRWMAQTTDLAYPAVAEIRLMLIGLTMMQIKQSSHKGSYLIPNRVGLEMSK